MLTAVLLSHGADATVSAFTCSGHRSSWSATEVRHDVRMVLVRRPAYRRPRSPVRMGPGHPHRRTPAARGQERAHRRHGSHARHVLPTDARRQWRSIAPTGRRFSINMATVGIWNRQGTMDEEFLFFDNQTFYRQIGLA